MLKVSNNNITITRGDSGVIMIHINGPDGTEYKMAEGDKAVLTVKKTTTAAKALITLDITDGMAKFKPSDTAGLDYGNYVYDCQLSTASGDVYTFITPHTFRIAEEVTF